MPVAYRPILASTLAPDRNRPFCPRCPSTGCRRGARASGASGVRLVKAFTNRFRGNADEPGSYVIMPTRKSRSSSGTGGGDSPWSRRLFEAAKGFAGDCGLDGVEAGEQGGLVALAGQDAAEDSDKGCPVWLLGLLV